MVAKGRGGGKTPERVVTLLREKVKKSSQAATSRASGLTLQTVQRYIKGIGEPSEETLQKLSIYFEKPVTWLRGENFVDFWGQVYGDRLTKEEEEELKVAFWGNRAERAAHSPVLREVVKCLTKVPSNARNAAFAIIKNTCRYIESLPEDELIKAGEDLIDRLHKGHKGQQKDSQKKRKMTTIHVTHVE